MKNKIIEAYKKYIEGSVSKGLDRMWYGSEDQKAPNIMHEKIASEILPIAQSWGYEVRAFNHGGEIKLQTEIHQKDIDVAVIDPSTKDVILAISFKMPMSSVNKNIKNFGESHIGDTALIKESGIPFFYIAIIDKYPIKVDDGKFGFEELSNKSLNVFKDIMAKPRSNKYRSDVIFIMKINFGDKIFKENYVGRDFSKQIERKEVGNQHLLFLQSNLSASSIEIETLKGDGNWSNDFDNEWAAFLEMICLELALHKIRKSHF